MKIVRLVSAYDEDQTTFHNEFNSDIILKPYSKVAVHNCTIPLIQNLFTVDGTLQNNQFTVSINRNNEVAAATITIPDGDYTYDGLLTAIENALYASTDLADFPLEFRARKEEDKVALDVRMPTDLDFDPNEAPQYVLFNARAVGQQEPDNEEFEPDYTVNQPSSLLGHTLNKGSNVVLCKGSCVNCPQFAMGAAGVPNAPEAAKFYCGIVSVNNYLEHINDHGHQGEGFYVTQLDLAVYIDPDDGLWKYNYGASTGNLVTSLSTRASGIGATTMARNGDLVTVIHSRANDTITITINNAGTTYYRSTITTSSDSDILFKLKTASYRPVFGLEPYDGSIPHYGTFRPVSWTPTTSGTNGADWYTDYYLFMIDFTDFPITRGFLGYSATTVGKFPDENGVCLFQAADQLTNVDDTRGILITLPSLPSIDGYDGAITDDRGQGQRLPVVGVIPVTNKIGSSIVHSPNDLIFCEVKNMHEISLRELEWRYLTSKLQALQSRNTTLTLVFKDQNE